MDFLCVQSKALVLFSTNVLSQVIKMFNKKYILINYQTPLHLSFISENTIFVKNTKFDLNLIFYC